MTLVLVKENSSHRDNIYHPSRLRTGKTLVMASLC